MGDRRQSSTGQPLLRWQDTYTIGIPAVDHEHRELIELINIAHGRLSDIAGADAVLDVLSEIHVRISAHFALEERVMRDLAYDEYEDHKADHERLLDDILAIMDDYEAARGYDRERFAARLDGWFTEHFRTRDARLHRFLHGPGSRDTG